MALEKDIEIGIGSGGAKRGASAIRRALDSIKRKSKEIHNSGARDAKKHSKALGLVAKATTAISGFIIARSVIKSQIDFGQAVSDLSAITGAVGEDLEFLRQKSKEFGETTTLSATEAAEAFKIIASAKPDLLENVEALSLVTEEAIALAEATGETLPSAANVMASALNQFGKGADDASRFINVLAAGSKRGAALVGEMGEALKSVGVIASQAGINFEETNAALQLMSTRAIKGGEAGMQFRGVLLALTAQSRDEFKPEVVGLQTALQNLSDAGLDQGSKSVLLFGRRNLAVAKTLIQNRAQLAKLTTQLTGTNIAYEQQAIRVDNLSGDIKTLKSAYEGLELTIGAELNGALRNLTQAATDNVRALSQSPLLKKSVIGLLDLWHRELEDIGLAFDQITEAVTTLGGGAANFEGVWTSAIQNIVTWTKFLWEQFVIGGPANLKLGFTFMIAAFDRFRIMLIEKIRTFTFLAIDVISSFSTNFVAGMRVAVQLVIKAFQTMSNAIGRTFDNLKVTINSAIDSLIEGVQSKVQSIANVLESMGFEDRASEIQSLADAIGNLATNEEEARAELEKNEAARQAEIDAIDDAIDAIREKANADKAASREITDLLIKDTEAVADAAREGSRVAVQAAIDERDATIETIKALRTKRKEIVAASEAASIPPATVIEGGLEDPALAAIDAYGELGDLQKNVVDNMADGIADFAATGSLNFKEFAANVIQDIIRMQAAAAATSFFSKAFSAIANVGISSVGAGFATGGTGAGSGVLPIGTGGISPEDIGGTILNAQHGAEFRVGGSGGVDSQQISINATPNEIISIKTPQQVQEKKTAFRDLIKALLMESQQRQADIERPASPADPIIVSVPSSAREPFTAPPAQTAIQAQAAQAAPASAPAQAASSALPAASAPPSQVRVSLSPPEKNDRRTAPADPFEVFVKQLKDFEDGLPGFQEGGAFKVGGSGGADSQFVAFKASPNESVAVTKPGQGSGAQPINITFNQNIVADGADSEKLKAELPVLLENARQAAVADVIQLRDKGVFR